MQSEKPHYWDFRPRRGIGYNIYFYPRSCPLKCLICLTFHPIPPSLHACHLEGSYLSCLVFLKGQCSSSCWCCLLSGCCKHGLWYVYTTLTQQSKQWHSVRFGLHCYRFHFVEWFLQREVKDFHFLGVTIPIYLTPYTYTESCELIGWHWEVHLSVQIPVSHLSIKNNSYHTSNCYCENKRDKCYALATA